MLYVDLLLASSVEYGRQKRDSRQRKMENTLIRKTRVPVASGFNLFLGDVVEYTSIHEYWCNGS